MQYLTRKFLSSVALLSAAAGAIAAPAAPGVWTPAVVDIGVALTLAIVGLLFWSRLLQRRVAQRTQALTAAVEELREREAYSQALFAGSRLAMVVMDPVSFRFVDCNEAAVRLYGLGTRNAVLGLGPVDVSDPLQYDDMPSHLTAPLHIQAGLLSGSHVFEWRHRRPDGQRWDAEVHLMLIDHAGTRLLVFTLVDISARKCAEREIESLAFFDPLTRLPNRRLMRDRLDQAMACSARGGEQGALLLIDLDNFKTLNDTRGHGAGDSVLVQVAQRLERAVRVGDTVARLGGDEFVVILRSLAAADGPAQAAAAEVAERILGALIEPYTVAETLQLPSELGALHHGTASMGIALFEGTALGGDELMRRADAAMYQAKDAGRNTFRFFDPVMQSRLLGRLALEAELRSAIDGRQFVLHFQPQVDVDGLVLGAEVLVRWQHPVRGLVPPLQFIPAAEETGLIVPLGDWVLEQACRQLARWQQQPALARLTLAVNVSARQFGRPEFESRLRQMLHDTGADPRRLKLELTESVLMDNAEETVAKMHALKALQLSFSLDDFGTGYSSLSYLRMLPLDQLKIDRSFVRDAEANASNAAIARTIVALGCSLGMDVIAEGVETAAQRDVLAAIGCRVYQGYLFGRPVELAAFEARVRRDGDEVLGATAHAALSAA